MTMHIMPKTGCCDYIFVNSSIQTCYVCSKHIDLATDTFIQDNDSALFCEECGELIDKNVGYVDRLSCTFCDRDVTLETAYYHKSITDEDSSVIMCADCFHNEIKVYHAPHTTLIGLKGWRKEFKKYPAGAFKIAPLVKSGNWVDMLGKPTLETSDIS